MKVVKDGGPALQGWEISGGAIKVTSQLSLRDYFAAKALQGFVVNECLANYDDMASAAYELADTMLAARENVDSQKQGA